MCVTFDLGQPALVLPAALFQYSIQLALALSMTWQSCCLRLAKTDSFGLGRLAPALSLKALASAVDSLQRNLLYQV